MKAQVIVCDPAWSFSDTLKKMKAPTRRSAVSQYPTMSIGDICSIGVPDIADPQGCVLALWVPSTLLADGLRVMDAWGFKLKQTFVWIKTKKPRIVKGQPSTYVNLNDALAFGMGRLFRQSHEIALIGTSGKTVYPWLEDHSQRSVILAPNKGHSRKPEELQDRLETMFPNANKVELFARRTRKGWDCLGNAIDGKDIGVAVHDLSLV